MSAIRYTKDHEYVRLDGDVATIGITDHAQEQLGDIVFVELPQVGKSVEQGGEAAVVESVKAASEVYAPVSGEVIEVNAALEGEPAKVNADPLGDGWFMKLKVRDKSQFDALMDEAAYNEFVATLS
ncbi:MAG: glycine cleavage system protein GcvH [Methylobacteriaceae bacterium]|nr:glycine cleavage system protein GcvH [Methylobacteriaceae bacterium]MBV9393472.1 glycine cleavage system protein GcvH [Methylobacteriaceae bacterium]